MGLQCLRKAVGLTVMFTVISVVALGGRSAMAANTVIQNEVRDSLEANTHLRLIRVCTQTAGVDCGVLAKSDGEGHPLWTENPVGFGATDLESAYVISGSVENSGIGDSVSIVEPYDDPDAQADMNAYRSEYGLPSCTSSSGCFLKLNENGNASPLAPSAPLSSGWPEETSLDLDMVSTACPLCNIVLVEANSTSNVDLFTAEAAAAATDPSGLPTRCF